MILTFAVSLLVAAVAFLAGLLLAKLTKEN
jgi:hypothetical protein